MYTEYLILPSGNNASDLIGEALRNMVDFIVDLLLITLLISIFLHPRHFIFTHGSQNTNLESPIQRTLRPESSSSGRVA
jgi:hypothetical protein